MTTRSKTIRTTKKTVLQKKFNVEELLAIIQQILENGKARDILPITLKGKTSLADYLVIASGSSTRQVNALASTLYEKLKDMGYKPRLEGKEGSGEWVIIDLGDIIIHLFYPQTRAFYEIEKLWGEKTPMP